MTAPGEQRVSAKNEWAAGSCVSWTELRTAAWEPCGWPGAGLTAPEPPGGAQPEAPATGSDSHPDPRELRDSGPGLFTDVDTYYYIILYHIVLQ